MSNYNSQLQSNNTDLQGVLELLQTKAVGENLNEEISTQTALLLEQDAKIAELAEILTSKASGSDSSDSIQTCTVTLTAFNYIGLIGYTVYENNSIVTYSTDSATIGSNTIIMNNVICGSAIFFENSYPFNGYDCSGGASLIKAIGSMAILMAPQEQGANATISIYDND